MSWATFYAFSAMKQYFTSKERHLTHHRFLLQPIYKICSIIVNLIFRMTFIYTDNLDKTSYPASTCFSGCRVSCILLHVLIFSNYRKYTSQHNREARCRTVTINYQNNDILCKVQKYDSQFPDVRHSIPRNTSVNNFYLCTRHFLNAKIILLANSLFI